jgi:hypothetical protein
MAIDKSTRSDVEDEFDVFFLLDFEAAAADEDFCLVFFFDFFWTGCASSSSSNARGMQGKQEE